MPRVFYVSAKGDAREVDVPVGTTVMAAALRSEKVGAGDGATKERAGELPRREP
jgi:hypothetical protein